jgi:hypothetical protein
MYLCDEKKYNYIDFSQFQNFIEHNFDPLHIVSWNNPIVGVPYATLFYWGRKYKMVHKAYKVINVWNMVIQEVWVKSLQEVKTQVTLLFTHNIAYNRMLRTCFLASLFCSKNIITTQGYY